MDERTPRRTTPRIGALVVLATLIVPSLAGCGGPPSRTDRASVVQVSPAAPKSTGPPTAPAPARADARTQMRIDYLVARVTTDPDDGDAQLELGLALLQRIRETADPSLYPSAETALTAARRLLPGDPQPLIGLGGLQLGRHEFSAALATGRSARKLDASSVGGAAIEIDALVELGRYDEAFRAIDELAKRSSDLTTLTRLSYGRELRGDVDGALAAMRQAARSPSLAPENTAFALSIVGHLERLGGDPDAARTAFEQALELVPDHAPSLAGLGRLAIGDGDLTSAAIFYERAAAVVPLPEYVIALGEVREAAGDTAGASRQFDLARAEIALFKANGVRVDLDLALFDADHGNPEEALSAARAAYDATPTVRAADALAWSLLRLGRVDEAVRYSDAALRLGSRDPLLLYHAGVIAARHGDTDTARTRLTAALAADPGFSAVGAQDARAVLERLDAES